MYFLRLIKMGKLKKISLSEKETTVMGLGIAGWMALEKFYEEKNQTVYSCSLKPLLTKGITAGDYPTNTESIYLNYQKERLKSGELAGKLEIDNRDAAKHSLETVINDIKILPVEKVQCLAKLIIEGRIKRKLSGEQSQVIDKLTESFHTEGKNLLEILNSDDMWECCFHLGITSSREMSIQEKLDSIDSGNLSSVQMSVVENLFDNDGWEDLANDITELHTMSKWQVSDGKPDYHWSNFENAISSFGLTLQSYNTSLAEGGIARRIAIHTSKSVIADTLQKNIELYYQGEALIPIRMILQKFDAQQGWQFTPDHVSPVNKSDPYITNAELRFAYKLMKEFPDPEIRHIMESTFICYESMTADNSESFNQVVSPWEHEELKALWENRMRTDVRPAYKERHELPTWVGNFIAFKDEQESLYTKKGPTSNFSKSMGDIVSYMGTSGDEQELVSESERIQILQNYEAVRTRRRDSEEHESTLDTEPSDAPAVTQPSTQKNDNRRTNI